MTVGHSLLISRTVRHMGDDMTTLKNLMKAEKAAYAALMNDPRVIADTTAVHTPELYAAWLAAADAERAFREAMELASA